MKSLLLSLILFTFIAILAKGQQELFEIDGAIQLANSQDPNPDPGTIRWTGSSLEGFDGSEWKLLSNSASYVTDNENNRYGVVTIGTQTWMAENLRTTKFTATGLDIPLVTDMTEWADLTGPGYTWYNNTGSDYGALYNYAAVLSTKGICPSGWHVPSDSEWQVLSDYLGGDDVSGTKLKESGIEYWQYSLGFIDGNNESGFSALPGGIRASEGTFAFVGGIGHWWSSTSTSPSGTGSFCRRLERTNTKFTKVSTNGKYGASVRCLKN